MKKTLSLRWSLFASLGLLPLACGGATADTSENGAGSSAGRTSDGGPIGMPPSCTSPSLDPISGFTSCAEGYRYRGEAVACAKRRGNAEPSEMGQECPVDCSQLPRGICYRPTILHPYSSCASGCLNDDECPSESFCECSELGGVCRQPGNCRSDEDCESGYHCAAQRGICDELSLHCQTPADECAGSADCQDAVCESVGDHRACLVGGVCGRPFLIAGEPRHARAVARSDWLLSPLT